MQIWTCVTWSKAPAIASHLPELKAMQQLFYKSIRIKSPSFTLHSQLELSKAAIVTKCHLLQPRGMHSQSIHMLRALERLLTSSMMSSKQKAPSKLYSNPHTQIRYH